MAVERPRPQPTVQRHILAVALFGVGFGFPLGVGRTIELRKSWAREHDLVYAEARSARSGLVAGRPSDRKAVRLLQRRIAYHRLMGEKWERASRHPGFWRIVAPDPPEPE